MIDYPGCRRESKLFIYSFSRWELGWFILLTSVLGFWRVKRWERGILASQRESGAATGSSTARDVPMVSRIEQVFGRRAGSRGDLFRQGFSFRRLRTQEEDGDTQAAIRAEEGEVRQPNAPQHNSTVVHAPVTYEEERLQRILRESGFL